MPTLILPPLGERLALRYRAEAVIPAGLFAIGAGCFLMAWGSGVQQASWLTMLPGCLLASIGLGVTNTPVTNTTTGPCQRRAGMASGIDTSARFISLALNIAVMGFILVEGIASFLQAAPTGDRCRPAPLAGRTADPGTAPTIGQGAAAWTVPAETARQALAHGFGWVMLYGGVSVWLFALGSLLVFGVPRAARRTGAGSSVQ